MSWPIKKLGEVCEIKIGKTPRRGVVRYWTNGTLPWATISEVHGAKITDTNEKITEVAAKELNMTPFPKGTILYTFKLSVGRVGIASVDLFTNEAIAGFFIKDKRSLTPEWLFYTLPLIDYKPFLSNAVKGNTLNKQSLQLLPIPLPPLATQKQIVERLDKIAEAQKLNDGLIQKSNELFQSLLHQELHPVRDSKNSNGVNPAGKKWIVKRLKEISEINPSKAEINKLSENTIVSFLAMADVSENAEVINRQEKNLSEVKNGFTFFKDGDVLVAKITPCFENGKGAFVEAMKNGVGFGSTEFHVLRANQEVLLNKFLYYLVSDKKFRKVGAKFMTGSAGQQRISKQYLENYKIPLPSLETQKQIVAKLSAVQEYKTQLIAQKLKLKELFDSVLAKSFKLKPYKLKKLDILVSKKLREI